MHYRSLVSNRENLLAQRRALEQKANAIRAEIARIVALIDAKDAEIRTGKQDRKMLQSEKKVLEACNKSLEVGAPKFAFRPQVYEIFDFIAEKNVILESHRVRK